MWGTGIPKDKDEVKRREGEDGVGAGVNTTMLSEKLEVAGLTETARRICQKVVLVAKKNHEPVCMR